VIPRSSARDVSIGRIPNISEVAIQIARMGGGRNEGWTSRRDAVSTISSLTHKS
jgi:hypothetical protein